MLQLCGLFALNTIRFLGLLEWKTTNQWLMAAGMCSLTVLEARSETRCWQGHAPSTASRRRSFCAFFQSLVAPGCPWLLTACLLSLLVFPRQSSLCVSLPLHMVSFCKETSRSGLGVQPPPVRPYLNWVHLHRLFPNKITFWGTEGAPGGSESKETACSAGDPGSIPGSGRSPGGGWRPTPGFLPGESHGQKSLARYSPWGLKESDRTERHSHWELRFQYIFFGGRGNTIQPTTKVI